MLHCLITFLTVTSEGRRDLNTVFLFLNYFLHFPQEEGNWGGLRIIDVDMLIIIIIFD